MTFLKIARTQAASPKRVSLLNFEPLVSKFPVTESAFAGSVTTAMEKSLFLWGHMSGLHLQCFLY